MDNVWRSIFRKYVACYESIKTLNSNGILVDEAHEETKRILLDEIIETMRQEISE